MPPRPITPRVLPLSSCPLNWLLPFSTCFAMSSSSEVAQFEAATIFLLARSMPAITSSFTALALAPGVLKTTMPFSAHASTGILFTPTPARAIASSSSENSIDFMSWLRTTIPHASSIFSTSSYLSVSFPRPTGEILFKVAILYILFISVCINMQMQ